MACRRLFATLTLILAAPLAFTAGLESLTFGLSQAWTGNGYVSTPDDPGGPYDYDVTGSEPLPIDPFVSAGVRFALAGDRAVLAFAPSIEVGARRYVLYESGRVAPAQIETALGAEGTTLGRGSARVVTVRIPLPLAFELRFGGNAVFLGLSPTGVFRIPAGAVERRDEETDLSGLTSFFYSNLRYLMPEASLGYRFAMSGSVEAALRATWGVSVRDLRDATLPWYDQMRASIGFELGIRPPVSGLVREREQALPDGIEPFPDRDATD